MLATLTAAPARIFGLPGGTLAKGAPADLVLLDPDEPLVVDAEKLHSRARNTAFDGRKFSGPRPARPLSAACRCSTRARFSPRSGLASSQAMSLFNLLR